MHVEQTTDMCSKLVHSGTRSAVDHAAFCKRQSALHERGFRETRAHAGMELYDSVALWHLAKAARAPAPAVPSHIEGIEVDAYARSCLRPSLRIHYARKKDEAKQ